MKKKLIIATILATVCISPAMAREVIIRDVTPEEKADWYFDMMDTNNDGLISPREHAAFARYMFEEADLNNDGYISYDELLAEKRAERTRIREVRYVHEHPVVKLPNRVNANPTDHSVTRGEPDEPNSKYLSR